jgi:imidazolonepropionase-like amidohydrolase
VLLFPGSSPDEETLEAAVQAAHQAGKRVIAHATDYASYSKAEQAGVDIPTHVPSDKPLDVPSIMNFTSGRQRVVPTLIMMRSIVKNTGAPYSAYTVTSESNVTAMYQAGIPIIAGSDANTVPFVPANPPFGESLHEELELLVQAGLSSVDAIRGATSLSAINFQVVRPWGHWDWTEGRYGSAGG